MNTYETQDLDPCEHLAAAGYPTIHFYRDSGLTTFAFEENSRLLELAREYYADHAVVSPIHFGNSKKNCWAGKEPDGAFRPPDRSIRE